MTIEQVREEIAKIVKEAVCDYDESTPELMHSDKCFDECAKGIWCKKNIPIIADKILSTPVGGEVKTQCYHKGWLGNEGNEIYGRYSKDCPTCNGTGKITRPRTLRDLIEEEAVK